MAQHDRRASSGGGIQVSWGAAHRDKDGNLIARLASMTPPAIPTCVSFPCLWSYVIESLTFALVVSYHKKRIAYAEANRRKKILERYRTGEPSPQTFWQALHANIKLACPVCRKYNVDPILGRV